MSNYIVSLATVYAKRTRSGKIAVMRKTVGVLGLLMAMFGVLFTLQGFGAVQGSPMSNTTTWSVLGPIIALVGVGLAIGGWRGR